MCISTYFIPVCVCILYFSFVSITYVCMYCMFRFFVVKEGFLLYYSDTEARKYDKNRLFNTHPKVTRNHITDILCWLLLLRIEELLLLYLLHFLFVHLHTLCLISQQGVIPLGGCKVMECNYPSQKFAVKVSHADFKVCNYVCV